MASKPESDGCPYIYNVLNGITTPSEVQCKYCTVVHKFNPSDYEEANPNAIYISPLPYELSYNCSGGHVWRSTTSFDGMICKVCDAEYHNNSDFNANDDESECDDPQSEFEDEDTEEIWSHGDGDDDEPHYDDIYENTERFNHIVESRNTYLSYQINVNTIPEPHYDNIYETNELMNHAIENAEDECGAYHKWQPSEDFDGLICKFCNTTISSEK
jgi:hypothetical protein